MKARVSDLTTATVTRKPASDVSIALTLSGLIQSSLSNEDVKKMFKSVLSGLVANRPVGIVVDETFDSILNIVALVRSL